MRSLIRRLFRLLPSGIQQILRHARSRIPLTAAERWVLYEYTPFAARDRQYLYLSIARFLHVNRPILGYYMEFGCHDANTMRMAWDSFRHLFRLDYIAFDSFEGLPQIAAIDRQDIWQQGKLKTEEERFISLCVEHGMPRDQLATVKGFYDRSLTEELRQRLSHKKAAVIYVDCDLYMSTVPVLEFARHFLQKGTVIVFDDWNCFAADPEKGERRAWREFRQRYPDLRFEDFLVTGLQKAFVYVGTTSEAGPQDKLSPYDAAAASAS